MSTLKAHNTHRLPHVADSQQGGGQDLGRQHQQKGVFDSSVGLCVSKRGGQNTDRMIILGPSLSACWKLPKGPREPDVTPHQ